MSRPTHLAARCEGDYNWKLANSESDEQRWHLAYEAPEQSLIAIRNLQQKHSKSDRIRCRVRWSFNLVYQK